MGALCTWFKASGAWQITGRVEGGGEVSEFIPLLQGREPEHWPGLTSTEGHHSLQGSRLP